MPARRRRSWACACCWGERKSVQAGILRSAACSARFLVHYVVGATIWAEYMPETFFNMTMTTPWFYSALYNGAYMLPDMVILLVIGVILKIGRAT